MEVDVFTESVSARNCQGNQRNLWKLCKGPKIEDSEDSEWWLYTFGVEMARSHFKPSLLPRYPLRLRAWQAPLDARLNEPAALSKSYNWCKSCHSNCPVDAAPNQKIIENHLDFDSNCNKTSAIYVKHFALPALLTGCVPIALSCGVIWTWSNLCRATQSSTIRSQNGSSCFRRSWPRGRAGRPL